MYVFNDLFSNFTRIVEGSACVFSTFPSSIYISGVEPAITAGIIPRVNLTVLHFRRFQATDGPNCEVILEHLAGVSS